MTTKRGKFIAIEGTDGVGKSTQVKRVSDALGRLGIEAVATREPGGTKLGESIRSLIVSPDEISLRAEALLLSAARAQHCDELIEPTLARGIYVVSDRFSGSFLAYQGFGRGLDIADLRSLTDFATDLVVPDLVLVLRSPDARASKALSATDRFESLGANFQERVEIGFTSLTEEMGWVSISSDGDIDTVTSRLMKVIIARFNLESPDEEQ